MAYNGYGVWSLVIQQVGGYAIRTILLWYFSNWRPKLQWSWKSFHYLWGFGNKLLASGLLNTIFNNVYPIVIGKFFTARDLGNYTRAQHFSALPSSNITGVLQRVTFPVLSRIQNEDERLAVNYRKILRLSAFLVFPMMITMSAIADPIVRVLLTDKWEDCIILLQILCFSMMLYPIHAINLNLLEVKGRSDLFLRLEIIKKVFAVIIWLIIIPKGIIWMVSGEVVISVLCLFVNTIYTGKLIKVGFCTQILDLTPILGLSFFIWVVIIVVNSFICNSYIQIIIGITITIMLFLLGARTVLRKEWDDAISMLPSKIQAKF